MKEHTPKEWRWVGIETDQSAKFKYKLVARPIPNGFIGFQTCAAAGIARANGLTLKEALRDGATVEKWREKQEGPVKKRKT
jgi:hypothetical protein